MIFLKNYTYSKKNGISFGQAVTGFFTISLCHVSIPTAVIIFSNFSLFENKKEFKILWLTRSLSFLSFRKELPL